LLIRISFCFPKKKRSQRKRGHENMLPIALAGARPHFRGASAHLTLDSRVILQDEKKMSNLIKTKDFPSQ
jgi:hypothetical protein